MRRSEGLPEMCFAGPEPEEKCHGISRNFCSCSTRSKKLGGRFEKLRHCPNQPRASNRRPHRTRCPWQKLDRPQGPACSRGRQRVGGVGVPAATVRKFTVRTL